MSITRELLWWWGMRQATVQQLVDLLCRLQLYRAAGIVLSCEYPWLRWRGRGAAQLPIGRFRHEPRRPALKLFFASEKSVKERICHPTKKLPLGEQLGGQGTQLLEGDFSVCSFVPLGVCFSIPKINLKRTIRKIPIHKNPKKSTVKNDLCSHPVSQFHTLRREPLLTISCPSYCKFSVHGKHVYDIYNYFF